MTRINLFHPKTEKTMLKRLLRALGIGKPADLTPTAHVRPAPPAPAQARPVTAPLLRHRRPPPAAPVPPFLRRVVPPPRPEVPDAVPNEAFAFGAWVNTVPTPTPAPAPRDLECKRDEDANPPAAACEPTAPPPQE